MTEPVCPYCRMPFEEGGPVKIFCTACGTPHHDDCYRENGGCTVFGCSRAPADDPKLQVLQSDLHAVNVPSQPAQLYAQQPYAQAQQGPVPRSQYGSSPLGLSQAAAAPAPAPAATAGPAAAPPMQAPPAPPAGTYFYQQAAPPLPPYAPPMMPYAAMQKSRTAYIVLGIFLGMLGVHNFYAGFTGKAVGQLCLTVLTLGYLGVISWIWAIVEVCVVTQDSQGIPFN
jgi:TM2 domain-containing membrane protein YozV